MVNDPMEVADPPDGEPEPESAPLPPAPLPYGAAELQPCISFSRALSQSSHPQPVHPQSVHPQSVHPQSVHPQSVHPQPLHSQSSHPASSFARPPLSQSESDASSRRAQTSRCGVPGPIELCDPELGSADTGQFARVVDLLDAAEGAVFDPPAGEGDDSLPEGDAEIDLRHIFRSAALRLITPKDGDAGSFVVSTLCADTAALRGDVPAPDEELVTITVPVHLPVVEAPSTDRAGRDAALRIPPGELEPVPGTGPVRPQTAVMGRMRRNTTLRVIGAPGEFDPLPAPDRNYECVHYDTCLGLAAAFDWSSFTCEGCAGVVDERLIWRAHQRVRNDKALAALCSLPELKTERSGHD